MGKTLEVLAKGEVPKNTIFSERFVAESCESFHFHFRNIRFEFHHDDFLRLREALKEIEQNYIRYGEKKSHHHLELGRALLDPKNSSKEISIELCDNIYTKYPTGWDSHFHDEDSFIHLHWRDMRIEMSNAEFLEFGKVVTEASEKLCSYKSKTLSEIFNLLDKEKIIYAVLRNWEHLPEGIDTGPHSDLDLLVHPDHVDRFDELLNSQLTSTRPYRVQRRVDILTSDGKKSYVLVDLRQPGDSYYPLDLAYRMLQRRVRFKNFWVLHPEDHIIGLAYHILFHKGYVGIGYFDKLKWLSSHLDKWKFTTSQSNDLTPYLTKLLSDTEINYVSPIDLTVRPILPMIYPYKNLISNRYLWHYNKQPIFSRIYKVFTESGKAKIVKQTNSDFLKHEFDILRLLNSAYYPRAWGYENHDSYSIFYEEYVDGELLSNSKSIILKWTFSQAKGFVRDCIEMLKTLDNIGIQHRDFHADNILLTKNGPVLVDFGWASSKEYPMLEPEGAGLGKEGRPPEGGPYDPYALGVALKYYIDPYFPEFKELIEILSSSRFHRPIDWDRIECLFNDTKETVYCSVEDRFLAYCSHRRYHFAEKLISDIPDTKDDLLLFWIAYVRFINRGDHFPSDIDVPKDIDSNSTVLARLLQECISTDRINPGGLLLNRLISAYLCACNGTDSLLFVQFDKHFDELLSVVERNILESIYNKSHRQKEWINLLIDYLNRYSGDQDQSELLSIVDSISLDLSPHSLATMAQIYFRFEIYDKAQYYANLALSHDPYFSECARILAICSERKNNLVDAIRFWKQYITLSGKNDDSCKNLVHLKFQRKIENQNRLQTTGTKVNATNPDELLHNIKQLLDLNEPEMALSYAEKLNEVLINNEKAVNIYHHLKTLIANKPVVNSNRRLIIPELTEETYSENLPVIKKQIEELLRTHLGQHRIIKDKYRNILEKKGTQQNVRKTTGNTRGKGLLGHTDRLKQSTDIKGNGFIKAEDRKPLVSIIIPLFNQVEYTKQCFEALVENTSDELYEVIMVDNGSTDGTAHYLESLSLKYRINTKKQNIETSKSKGRKKKSKKKKAKKIVPLNKTCTGVTVIKNEKNMGFAAGNNQGMAVAKGDYILLMNNDVVVTPGWLKRMISCAEQSPQIGIVGPMSNYVSGPQLVKEVSYDTTSLARLNKFSREFAEKNTAQGKLIWRVVGFCMLIKRAVIDKIGGMDDRYGLGNFEDDDFSLRAALAGFESRIAEDCFVHHFGSRTFIGAKIDYRESLSEKWEIFKKKWGMPQDLPYGSSYDFSQIAKKGFIKEKHYYPLTEKDSSAIAEKDASFDLLEAREEIDSKVKLKATDKGVTASIIIPVQKGKEHLEKCVESIQKHTPESYELIFVKNGSESGALKWLRQLVKENSRCQIVDCGKDASIAKCYNEGTKASSGKHIVLLHSDVVVTEGWLSVMLECIFSTPDAGIVGPMTNNTIGVQKVADADSASIDHLQNYAKTFREKYRYRRVPIRVVNNFCMLFRRDLVEKIGLLDESLGFGSFENEDFCLRATLEGYKNLIASDVFIYKHNGKSQSIGRKAFNEKWSGISARSSLGKKLLASKALEKAVELDAKGQIDNAVKMLLEGMGHAPKDKRLNYAIAEMLINNKQFKDAFDTLNEMPLDDQDVMKLALIGYCMEGMERYDEAEEYADRALPLGTASALALNLKGILAFGKGDKATAEDFFKRAINSDPGYGEPYTNLGTLKWDQEAEEALNLYEKGFILSPTIIDTVTIYHSAVTNLGRLKRAEPIFRDASVLHPNNRRLKFLIIDILVQLGKHDLAMKEIEGTMIAFGIDDGILSAALQVRETLGSKEIEKSSKKMDTISLCMIVKNEEQHLGKCLMSVKSVVDEMIVVDTGSTDRTMDIARAFGARVYDFKWTNDFSEARNYSISKASGAWIFVLDADEVISSIDYDSLRKIVKKSRTEPSAYYFVTRNYTALTNTAGWVSNDGRYTGEQAGTGWYPSKKVRLFPSDSRIRFENHVHELVEPSLERLSIKLKECSIPVHHYGKLSIDKVVSKGQEYYILGKTKLEGKTDDVKSLTELAIQALELGKHEEALEFWQRVIEIKPDNTKALLNMGGIYLELGRYEDALRASRKAMALGSHLKEVVLNYSSSELFIGDIEKSVSSLENLVRNEPEYPPAIAMLSTAYFILGEKEKGLEYIDKIKKMGFNLSNYLYIRAKQFISAGKTDYAILLLEIATESNNANRDVISLLFECYRTYGTVVGNMAIQSKNLESISSPEIRQ